MDSPTRRARPLAHLLTRHICLWAALGLLTALAFVGQPVRAAVTEAWLHRYSNVLSNSTDQAFRVVRDAASDIIVVGSTDDRITGQDILTIKYSGADGSVLWQKRYNGPANGNDFAQAVAVDSTGNVVVTGFSDNGTNSDCYTAKYAAADGTMLWEKRYNGPANGYDQAKAVAVDASGNVVVTGLSFNGSGNSDYYTAKYAAPDGALLWERRYNGPANNGDYATSLAVDGSGNVVVTGYSWNSAAYGDADYYTAKYATADGALLWEKRYNGPYKGYDVASAVAVDASGNVVVTGYSHNSYNGLISPDYYTAKYAAANGALLWEQRYNGPANQYDEARAVAVDGSGNVVVTGYSQGDNYTAKYAAADGALLWEQRYNGLANNDSAAQAVAVDGSGNVVVTGTSDGYGAGGDHYTVKYAAADGALLWEKHGSGGGSAVAVDDAGNVVVTGSSYGTASDWDFYTAKYAAADGALLWEKRYNGPANNNDSAVAVTVDGSGDVVATGFSIGYYTAKYAGANGALLWEKHYNGPEDSLKGATALVVDSGGNLVVAGTVANGRRYDYYTAKYAAADGALLWEQRHDGTSWDVPISQAVAVDATGNVVVTGVSDNETNTGFYTAKYAAANGALLWEQSYHGPANLDAASAVAADGSGNVVVTGYSANTDFNFDYYTAEYAAADGTLLWEKRYSGPANSDDRASAVGVDGSGNVVVTGHSNNGTNDDYYTAKYAAPDGTLLWEKRYNGLANSYDEARALAVDSGGNVVVTGYSWNGSGNSDYYTAKYAAADGALLWEKRYNGPANFDDTAEAVAVDGSGSVVVAGTSWGGASIWDYYTAKYAAADGALLWEKRYNGPANGEDIVLTSHCLSLGPNGMVAVTGSSSGAYATVVYRENQPPLAVAKVSPLFSISPNETDLFILSPNNADATVVLDGSQSSDADNDPLQFSWYADGHANALATGALATNPFAVGPHTVQLAVSDGHDTATAQVRFEVITRATAVGQLMLLVDEASLGSRNKQPLLATLSAAMSSFDRGDPTAALNQLSAFQNKVRAQVTPWNPALANQLTAAAQQIIDVVRGR